MQMTTTPGWHQVGGERGGDYTIERGPWRIVPRPIGARLIYTLYRGAELQGEFPDAHEAAVHADLTEAGHL